MSQPVLIHLHIPKTAGTTLSRMIRLKLMAWPPSHWIHRSQVVGFDFLPWPKRLRYLKAITPAQRSRLRFFQCHMGYGAHEFIPGDTTYITILRRPVSRILSLFHYLHDEGRIDRGRTLEDFVDHPRPHMLNYVDNGQVRFLAGEQGEIVSVPKGFCKRDQLDLAKQRVDEHFLLAGMTERFDECAILLRRLLNWRSCYYSTSNVTKTKSRRNDISQSVIDSIREQNALDEELCDHVEQRLDRMIAQQGPEFHDELMRFKTHNTYYNTLLRPVYNFLPKGRAMIEQVERVNRPRPDDPSMHAASRSTQ